MFLFVVKIFLVFVYERCLWKKEKRNVWKYFINVYLFIIWKGVKNLFSLLILEYFLIFVYLY